MASQIAGRALKSAASARVSQITGQAQRAGGPKIKWEEFNFPCPREPCNILHFDLAELRAISERAFNDVRIVYAWYILTLVIVNINLLNSIILSAGIGNAAIFSGVNVLYAFFNVFIAALATHFVLYTAYRGLAEGISSNKQKACGVLAVCIILAIIQSLVGAGNSNGFANLGSDRMAVARAIPDLSGITGYWSAVTVIESILWLVDAALGGFACYKVWTH